MITELLKHDGDLPVIITHDGKDHQYGITDEGIEIIDDAYFGNDQGAWDAFPTVDKDDNEIERKYLNIGRF